MADRFPPNLTSEEVDQSSYCDRIVSALIGFWVVKRFRDALAACRIDQRTQVFCATAEPSSDSAVLSGSRLRFMCVLDNLSAMDELHRKQVRHYHRAGDVHELTFSCYCRRALLNDDDSKRELARAIDRSMRRHRFALLAFVFMPEHVHLLVAPLSEVVNLPRLLSDFKRPTSAAVKRRLIRTDDPLLAELTVQQRPGVTTFRFWQEGPGFDRNLDEPKTIQFAIDYIHMNPVRRGLCSRAVDWPWSSARPLLTDANLVGPPRVSRFDVTSGLIEVGD